MQISVCQFFIKVFRRLHRFVFHTAATSHLTVIATIDFLCFSASGELISACCISTFLVFNNLRRGLENGTEVYWGVITMVLGGWITWNSIKFWAGKKFVVVRHIKVEILKISHVLAFQSMSHCLSVPSDDALISRTTVFVCAFQNIALLKDKHILQCDGTIVTVWAWKWLSEWGVSLKWLLCEGLRNLCHHSNRLTQYYTLQLNNERKKMAK